MADLDLPTANLPVVVTVSGAQPRSPADVQAQLLAIISGIVPDYTANLPGLLIEDILNTDVAAILQCDNALVETINSLTPFGANAFLLNQLGQMLGIPIGGATNTSVFILFTCNTPGFVIGKGFLVQDSQSQYTIVDGGIIGASGQALLFALATIPGSFAVPAGTVTSIVSAVPTTITLSCINPIAGLPGAVQETEGSYRARVQQGNLAASQGMSRYLKTLLGNVPGVQPRLISVQAMAPNGWKIIVGGGDPYQVANAIYTALFDISTLVGSTLAVSAFTRALPGQVSTLLNHLFAPGQAINIFGTTPIGFSGNFVVVSVIDQKNFTVGLVYPLNMLTAQSWAATGGGQNTYTTTTPHGITVGSSVTIVGSTPAGYNVTGVALAGTTASTIVLAQPVNPTASTVLGQVTAGVSLFDSTGLTAWVSGGVITPNLRNVAVSILDYPDTYLIPYINPPQQTVTMTVSWHTTSPNFVAAASIAQMAAPALASYINSIPAGQPINVLALRDVFEEAVEGIIPMEYISVLTFGVAINGVGTAPAVGTELIQGDSESYFFALSSGINVVLV
jgi:hypothetical protein